MIPLSAMKKTILYLLLLGYGIQGIGQSVSIDSMFEPKLSGALFYMTGGTVGKQFYSDDWTNGDIKLHTGEWVFNKKLKYNTLLDEIIWLQVDSFRQVKLEKHFIDEVCFKNINGKPVRFIRIRYKSDPLQDTTDIFVEVLTEKKASLVVYRKVIPRGKIIREYNGVSYSYDMLVP